MRKFLVFVWACLVFGTTACATPPASPPARSALPTDVAVPRILMDENFALAWPDDRSGSAWFADGGYRLAARRAGEFVAVRAPLADVPRDVIVSGTFQKLGGPPGGGYGLVLEDQGIGAGDGKDQSGQFVVAAVGDRGEVGLWRRDGERWADLMPWTRSSAVHQGAVANDLSVQLLGGRLTFVVNGQQVADLDTLGQHPGGVGIFTGGDLNEVVVNRFRVQAPGRPIDLGPVPEQSAAPRAAPESRPLDGPPPGQRPPIKPPESQRVRELLTGIADDMGAIAGSFAGGLDNPHDPVRDPIALKQDATRLAEATAKARELQAELERLQHGAPGGR